MSVWLERTLTWMSLKHFAPRICRNLTKSPMSFFASDTVHDAIREKVTALYPEAEIEPFVELFWNRVQDWRRIEGTGP